MKFNLNKVIKVFLILFTINFTINYDLFAQEKIKINGQITNIFHETIDSVLVILKNPINEAIISSCYTNNDGYFNIEVDNRFYNDNLKLICTKIDYRYFETFVKLDSNLINLRISLIPRYKILLKGRIYIQSTPLEDVNVQIIFDTNTYNLTTLGCYYDEENYWNCLYYGMFKAELITENPDDTIKIICKKIGYKPLYYNLKFSEYDGSILKLKMRYADSVPDLGKNNFHLKFTNPFGNNSRWFLNFSYYRNIKFNNFNRLYLGGEFSINTKTMKVNIDGLPQYLNFISYDTSYINYFVGPSALLFITKPERRYFSSYISLGLLYSSANNNIIFQPSIGTKIFLDMQKSLNIELRYLNYDLKIKNYIFNYYGDAIPYYKTINDKSIIFTFGLQINL